MKKIIGIVAVILLIGGGVWYATNNSAGIVSSTATSTDATTSAQTDPSTFTESSLGFSFAIPAGFHTQKLLDDSGETILVQSADGTNGFQVYITAYGDPASSITKANIQKEAGMTVANDSPITVGDSSGAGQGMGLQFDSTADTPPTRQAWFVYEGNLYQAQVWASDASLLQQILSTWKFSQ
jgi:hypothetical protein